MNLKTIKKALVNCSENFSKYCNRCAHSRHLHVCVLFFILVFILAFAMQLLILDVNIGKGETFLVTHTSQADFEAGTIGASLDKTTSPGDIVLAKQTRETTTEEQFLKGNTWQALNRSAVANGSGGEVVSGKSYVYSGLVGEGPAIDREPYTTSWFDENSGFVFFGSPGVFVVNTNSTTTPEDDVVEEQYDMLTIPALESDSVQCVFTDPTSRYIYVCNNETLQVIDTDLDSIAMTYSLASDPALTGLGVRNAYLDPITGYLYINTWTTVTVIDMGVAPGGGEGDEDVIIETYDGDFISAAPESFAVDSANDVIYIATWDGVHVISFGVDGVPGGADDTLENTYDPLVSGAESEVVLVNDGLAGRSNNSKLAIYDFNSTLLDFTDDTIVELDETTDPKMDDDVRTLFYDAEQGILYVTTTSTMMAFDPETSTVLNSYTSSTNPSVSSLNYNVSKMAYDSVNKVAYILELGYFLGVNALNFDDYLLNSEYRGQPKSLDYFSYEAVSQTSALGGGDSVSIETRGGAEDAYWMDDFDNGDTSNVSDLGWGDYWGSVTESDGILTLADPTGSDTWTSIDSGLPAESFPIGSTIRMRVRPVVEADVFELWIFYDDFDSSYQYLTKKDEWVVIDFPVRSDVEDTFSKVGFEFYWSESDQVAGDKLEIDWISMTKADDDPDWDAWSAVDVDGGILSDLVGDSWLQYRLLIENADSADSPSVDSVTYQQPEYATGGEIESSVIDAGESVDWQEFTSTTVLPADTYISFWTRSGDVAVPDGTWSDWRSATEVIRSPDSQYLQWKAELASNDSSATPTLSAVAVSYFTPAADPAITSVDFSTADDFTREDVRDTAVPAVAQFNHLFSGNGELLDAIGDPVDLSTSTIKPGCRIDIGGEEFIISTVYDDVTNPVDEGYAWVTVTQEGLMPDEVDAAVPAGISSVGYIYCTDINGEVRLGSDNYIVEHKELEFTGVSGEDISIIRDPASGNIVAFHGLLADALDPLTNTLISYPICDGAVKFIDAVYDSADNQILYTCEDAGGLIEIEKIDSVTGTVTDLVDSGNDKPYIVYISSTDKAVLYGDNSGIVLVYDATTGVADPPPPGAGLDITRMAYDSNRDALWFVTNEDDVLALYDVEAGEVLKRFSLPDFSPFTFGYNLISYDAKNDTVWTGSIDTTDIINVNAEDGELLGTVTLPNSTENFALFDGRDALAAMTQLGNGVYLIDRTTFEIEGLPYATGNCGEDIVSDGEELWVVGCEPEAIYHFIPAGVPTGEFYTTITTDTSQLGGGGTDGIESHAVVEHVSSDVFYAVSFDGRDSFKVFTAGAWRAVASSNASDHGGIEGVWYARDNADVWTEASADNANRAISEAVAAGANNQMDGTAFGALAVDDWTLEGGWSAGDTVDLAVSLRADDVFDDPTVSNFEIEFSEESSSGGVTVYSRQPILATTVSLISPNGGGTYNAGESVRVSWTSNSSIPYINLSYSTDFGATYIPIVNQLQNNEAYNWTVPEVNASRVIMRVEGQDLASPFVSDISDGTFSIVSQIAAPEIVGDVPAVGGGNIETPESLAAEERVANLAIPVHSLVKLANDNNPNTSDDTSVYYVGSNGYLNVFPNEKIYFSWYCDYSMLKIVDKDVLNAIQVNGAITMRPGRRMVKFFGKDEVYAVEAPQVLRHIKNESVAEMLYGVSWVKQIDELSQEFANSYKFNSQISSAGDYNVLEAVLSAYYPSDVFGIPGIALSNPLERKTGCIE